MRPARAFPKDHVPEPRLGVGSFEQVRQLPTRPTDWNRGPSPTPALGLVDNVTQIGGQSAVPHPGFVRGDLHCDRDKPIAIAFEMRPQQRLELFGTGHGTFPVALVVGVGWQRSDSGGPEV